MILVDIHAHLDYPQIEDLDGVIDRAKKAGVKAVIANSTSPDSMREVLKIGEKYDIVKVALGMYPPDALGEGEIEDIDLDKELKFIEDNKDKIIAIGECGLDYANCKDKELQHRFFKGQLEIAKKLDKPIIVHSRKAEEDVINILEESGYKKVVMHCFCGKKRLVKRAAELGYYFSIPTNVLRAQNLQGVVKEVDINKLLTETDTPFLSPYKEKTNEPAFVLESLKKIAEIKGFTEEETANNIWLNFQRLFL